MTGVARARKWVLFCGQLLVLVCTLAGLPAVAAEVQLVAPVNATSQAVRDELSGSGISVDLSPEVVLQPDTRLLVTLGKESFARVQEQALGLPVIAAYISRQDFYHLRQESKPVTALFSDANLEAQIALARILLPAADSLGVLESPANGLDKPAIEQAARRFGFTVHYQRWHEENPVALSLAPLLEKTDGLLGIPDSDVFNRQTAKTILLTAYRHNKPLFGPTAAFVKAGAIATTYHTARQTAATLARMIERYLSESILVSPRYVNDFEVAINAQVARSLQILHGSEAEVRDSIRKELLP